MFEDMVDRITLQSKVAFDAATALSVVGRGRYAGELDPSWWVFQGPNGGYVAAIMLRAAELAIDDPARTPRTLTVHYLRRPRPGPVELEATVERTGRRLSTVSVRMTQEDQPVAIGLTALSVPFDSVSFAHKQPRAIPEGARSSRSVHVFEAIPVTGHYTYWPLFGTGMFSGDDSAETGGWVRLSEDRVTDALLVSAVADCWPPAILTHLDGRAGVVRGVPTIELTVHFRTTLPLASMAPGDPLLTHFHSQTAQEGFIEETGEIWSPDGRLVAESRQLSLIA